jgi:hypothetical protein
MSDPNKDWLEKELESLRDLEAPPALLPKVMKRVHEGAGKQWRHLLHSPANLWRSFVLGISLAMLGFLLVINPAQFFSHVPGALALFNLLPLLLVAAKMALLEVKVFNLPLLELLAAAIVLSYILLIATASAIQHLASARK